MEDKVAFHEARLKLCEPLPNDVPVASTIKLKVKVMCPLGCDLSGGSVHLRSAEEILVTSKLAICNSDPGWSETDEMSAKAPDGIGFFSWNVIFLGHGLKEKLHEQATLAISFVTTPLATSLAIWDAPSPVIVGEPFKVKVGVKSSRGCRLTGAEVELLDDSGERKGIGALDENVWEGTTALFWTEIDAVAPEKEGLTSWSAQFAATDGELPHQAAVAQFNFLAVKPPDHKLTIMIFDEQTGAPIENAQVRLGCYKAATDACGVAEIFVPFGRYEVSAWMVAHELRRTSIEVTADMTVRLMAIALPEEDPGAPWMMRAGGQ
jgi:hypothetical protein